MFGFDSRNVFLYAADIVAGAQYHVLSVKNHSDIEVPIKLSIGIGFNQETSDFLGTNCTNWGHNRCAFF